MKLNKHEFNIFKNCIASKVQAKVYSVWLLTQHDDNGISYKNGYVLYVPTPVLLARYQPFGEVDILQIMR